MKIFTREYPAFVKKNYIASLRYAFNFSERLYRDGRKDFLAEVLLQTVRSLHFHRTGGFLMDSVLPALSEMGIPFDENQSNLIRAIEKGVRKEKDFYEACETLDIHSIKGALDVLRKYTEALEEKP